ncbi:M15 family metallopeptidase [Amycolatopsis anabasis]|uniref:M15 family metallopeptidase n=1 Tax=Amycolatopsis anabasis TaxID=1840409 RepID=UPI003CCCF6C0
MRLRTATALLGATAMLLTGCGSGEPPAAPPPPPPTSPMIMDAPAPATTPPPSTSASPVPAWQVGAHPLPRRPDGFGQVLPTPPELVDRALPTKDLLPPPADDQFAATVNGVPSSVLSRSTWQAGCPVQVNELRYLTLSFWGFDGRAHTGELLVNGSVADTVVAVFRQLFAARFPMEEMRVTRADELDAPPTGDGNNTSAFVCRPTRGQTTWSAHAYGLAIDVNPFCNPYTKGDLVLPELASAYTDRSRARPGMVLPGDAAVRAFTSAGWTWGGTWTEPKDIMHFSANGK